MERTFRSTSNPAASCNSSKVVSNWPPAETVAVSDDDRLDGNYRQDSDDDKYSKEQLHGVNNSMPSWSGVQFKYPHDLWTKKGGKIPGDGREIPGDRRENTRKG